MPTTRTFIKKFHMQNALTLYATLAAIGLYLGTAAYLYSQIRSKQSIKQNSWLIALTLLPIILHFFSVQHTLLHPHGIQLDLFNATSLILLAINLLIVISGIKKPLYTLLVFLFPLSALLLLTGTISPIQTTTDNSVNNEILTHALLSILAYSLFIIATLQAVLLAYQNHQIKNKNPNGFISALPPLQTMEALLFELLWFGEILLTIAILTGFVFVEDVFAQQLVHKTVFTLMAWVIYAVLLWGRHIRGWRGNTALRLTLGGFCFLMLAYFGSKFVLEVLLQ